MSVCGEQKLLKQSVGCKEHNNNFVITPLPKNKLLTHNPYKYGNENHCTDIKKLFQLSISDKFSYYKLFMHFTSTYIFV